MLRALLELCRISNLPTVWTNVTAAWVIASGECRWSPELAWLLLGGSLIYCAGMILNDTCDVAWDRQYRPERPIPSGRIALRTAQNFGIAGLVAGYLMMVFAGGAGWAMTALLVGAILLYDVYHKPWAGSVIVMGACRTLLYLSTALAALNIGKSAHLGELLDPSGRSETTYFDLDPGPGMSSGMVAGAIIGLYVVALTIIARSESKQGKAGPSATRRWQLGALLLLPPVAGSVVLYHLRHAGFWSQAATILMATAFLAWTFRALSSMWKGGPHIGQAVGLLLAGIPLVDGLLITPISPGLGLSFCVLPLLLRRWQRWVAAT